MPDIPFVPSDEKLQTVIRNSYIKPLTLWLLGTRPGRILAQEGNSSWESAMTVDFFVRTADVFRRCSEETQLLQNLEKICPEVCRWLLTKVVPTEGFCSWEKVTWDTAVILRTLLACIEAFPSSFAEQEKDEIVETAKQAVKWLDHRFRAWEEKVRYPFGPADVAQILITGLFIKKHYPKLFSEVKVLLEHLHRDIVKHLVEQTAQIVDVRLEDGTWSKVTWWGDYFQTAEVLESLALYYDDVKDSNTEEDKALKVAVQKGLLDACTYVEQTQRDGLWGTHVDTIRTLYAYIRVSTLVPEISCQPHLAFKALRWICDEKQFLTDGSFLHTMFLTIFMGPTLLAVHNDWPLAGRSITEVYDAALWASPVQSSVERFRRFEAETKISTLQGKLAGLKERLSTRRKLFLILVLTAAMFGITIWFSWWNKWLIISFVADPEDLWKLLSIIITVWAALLVAIWQSKLRG